MKKFTFLAAALMLSTTLLYGQVTCPNPIVLYSITVEPACGGNNGRIVFNIEPGAYTWVWPQNISFGPEATNLAPNTYAVHVERNGQPACALDTVLTVGGFPSAPTVQVVSVTPSNCFASNGTVQLAPPNYSYAWSNTEVGAFNDGLNSGTYTVTATEPGTGCLIVVQVSVPNVNPLEFTATVDAPSKCGRNTGRASFEVMGGSGQYSYSLGGQQVFGLGPGPGFGIVVDNTSGCADTAFFTIPTVVAEGTVVATVNDPRCAGQVGNAVINVLPGNFFQSPYTFAITTATGVPITATDSLVAGDYLVYVADADSCVLPPQPFTVTEPVPIQITSSVTPGSCDGGGQITLNASGGTGMLLVDWTDISGVNNGTQRLHLANGLYAAVVYDSLFCKDTLADILVVNNCSKIDTVRLFVPHLSSNTYCIPLWQGVAPNTPGYALVSPTNSSAFGQWTLQNNCLEYTSTGPTGLDLETVCVRVSQPALGITDTVCILVSVVNTALTTETVYFTTQVNMTTTACGTVPAGWSSFTVLPINSLSYSGNTPFGLYNLGLSTACIQFSAFGTPEFLADSISMAVCSSLVCHIIHFVPSILPFSDCSKGLLQMDSLTLPTVDCEVGAKACLDIPYANILNFNIIDNGQPYNQGALGCNEAAVTSYAVADIPTNGASGGGPYILNEWFVNGVAHTGVFADLNELIAHMNTIDPVPGWFLENFIYIIGGQPGNNYGPLRITNNNNQTGQAQPSVKTAPLGSELRFSTGEHVVFLKKIQTGCSDTLRVNVECFDCPPIHPFAPDQFNNIVWEAPSCTVDTLFATNIPFGNISDWQLFDNNGPLSAIQSGTLAAFRLDTGYHLMRLRNTLTTCEYFVSFYFDCRNAPRDTIFVTMKVGETIKICPDQTLIPEPIITVFHVCPQKTLDPNATITYDETNWCAVLDGESAGQDTLCLQLCNADGECVTTLVFVEVQPSETDEKIYVFNGISPNGDGKNDVWRILGLQKYPNNEVWVFNRNGNQVFHQKGYQNDWDGTWNDRLLPSGTYWYVIELGDGNRPVKGYLELNR